MGSHPILAPPAHRSPLAAWPRPPLLRLLPGDRRPPGHAPPPGQAAAEMKAEAGGDGSMVNLSVQQVLSLWAHGTSLRHLTGKGGPPGPGGGKRG